MEQQQKGKIAAGAPSAEANLNSKTGLTTDDITFDKLNVLGRGNSGTIVYQGRYRNKDVAVKAVFDIGKEVKAEIETLQKCKIHKNVVTYFHSQEEPSTGRILLALELCKASLLDWVRNNDCIAPASLQNSKALYQVTKGLAYLHSKQIIHSDLKPANILLSVHKNTATVKISDFGISKFLPDDKSSVTLTSVVGTEKWRAPEILKYIDKMESDGNNRLNPVRITMKKEADIFSLGCVCYYVITGGKHPFGNNTAGIRNNIVAQKAEMKFEDIPTGHSHGFVPLIGQMILSAERRPSAATILRHPALWKNKHIVKFLTEIRSIIQVLGGNNEQHILQLENYGRKNMGLSTSWKNLTSPAIHDYTNDYSHSLVGLVELMVDLSNIYPDLPQNVKQCLGDKPNGMMTYWIKRFPALIHTVWLCFEGSNESSLKFFYREKSIR